MTIGRRPTKAILDDDNRIRGELDCHPFIDAADNLSPNPRAGSFYIVSYVQDGKSKFTVLFHLMFFVGALGRRVPQLAISVFDDETHYFSKEMNYFWPDVTKVGEGLNITTPGGSLSGTIDSLFVKGQIEDEDGSNRFKMDLTMEPRGPVLPNLLTGVIPFADGVNYEYALPRMKTSGNMTVRDKQYSVTGWSWLDREWGTLGPSKWTWMNIQLDIENDEKVAQMSIWDEQTDNTNPRSYVGGPRRFATILSPTGQLIAAPVKIEELDHFPSNRTDRTYAKEWRVIIPGRADLNVKLLYDQQEIVSEVGIHRVEGKARVTGKYEGENRTGVAMVEMFNLFPLFG